MNHIANLVISIVQEKLRNLAAVNSIFTTNKFYYYTYLPTVIMILFLTNARKYSTITIGLLIITIHHNVQSVYGSILEHLPFSPLSINIPKEICDSDSFSVDAFGSDNNVSQTCITLPISTGMKERCFYTYIPECASENAPVVYDLHGTANCPSNLFKYTGWKELADTECFVLVLPTGNTQRFYSSDACWAAPAGLENLNPEPELSTRQCCCISCYTAALGMGLILDEDIVQDDLFLRTVASYLVQDVPLATDGRVTIDTKRLYFSGHSNGCMMAQAMAMLHSDLVAAVCCHAGALLTPPASDYQPTPQWVVHGKKDDFVEYDGALLYSEIGVNMKFIPQQERFDYLSELNGCTSYESETLSGFEDEGSVQRATNCTNNATVELVTLNDVSHYPYVDYNDNGPYPDLNSHPMTFDYESTEAAWSFCSSFESSAEPELVDITLDKIL